ncbi:MAG TPA: helix-turn-helix domain-containing protein [Ramlibacter sp.]|nr:helix-turn-helix domain-containing protein [Ramlibacter sp.]
MIANPSAPADAVRHWSTDAVAGAQRLDYWVGAICEAFLEMDCSSSQAQLFEARLTSVAVDVLSFNQVIACTQDVYRTPAAIARGSQHPFYLIAQRESAWHVRQQGHVVHLRPGDAVLVDSAQRYELHFPGSLALMSVQLPRHWVGRWLTQVDCAVPRVVARDGGWGQALSALCLQLAQEPLLAASYPSALLSDQLGAMLAAALEPPQSAPSPASRGLVERAQQLLRERLDQPGLEAQAIAQSLGVSVRTLHRAFAAGPSSFAGTLRRLRLEQAGQLLAQPRLANLTMGEVGRRCGFADTSHFVREFHQAFGQTPARWRQRGARG